MLLHGEMFLNWELELVNGFVSSELEPVSTLATLGFAFKDPEPLDVGVFLVANASHHSVAVHCIYKVWVLLCALSSAAGFQKEGVVISGFLGHQLKLLNASGVLDGIVQCVVFLYDG